MEIGASGVNGLYAVQPVTAVEQGGADFVTLHFQLMVEEAAPEMAMKRRHVTKIHVPVCSSLLLISLLLRSFFCHYLCH